jgi:hypothetical protein
MQMRLAYLILVAGTLSITRKCATASSGMPMSIAPLSQLFNGGERKDTGPIFVIIVAGGISPQTGTTLHQKPSTGGINVSAKGGGCTLHWNAQQTRRKQEAVR